MAPFDASGVFTRLRGNDSWKGDATAGTRIKSDLHDINDTDLASGLSECVTKSGKTQPTSDLPMAGHKLTNLGTPTNPNDAATKAYTDGKIDFSTGIALPGSAGAASIRFMDADIGFGTRRVDTPTVGLLNRFVWNDKPDLSGTDIATMTDVGNFSVTGTFTSGGAITATPTISVTGASAMLQIKPSGTGNGHVWWYAADGTTTRMILYTTSGAQGPGNLTVGGQNYAFGADGIFTAPVQVRAGAALMSTDGNVQGTLWDNWGAHDAYNAIGARIEARATAWANDRVANLQYRKVSQGYSGAATSFVAPAGAVLNGYERDAGPQSGQLRGCYYMYLQVYDPVRGWVGFSG